jgi:peptidoglycan-associated lipoprotein
MLGYRSAVLAVCILLAHGHPSAQTKKGLTMSTRIVSSKAAGLLALLVSAGCSHEAKPSSTATTVAITTAPLAPASPGKASSSIYLSDRLRAACNITTIASVKDAPKFDFDKSAILPEDGDVLSQVAICLTTGPLKGHAVKLVGRADPRGTQEYNMALGERRASSAMKYLAGLGVAPSQMTESSRGALDATGHDDAAWRQDRRVDIDIDGGS